VAENGAADQRPDPSDWGKPIGRRVVLSILAVGAVGVVTGRSISDALAKIAEHDPTGLLNVLPFGDNFRYYSVTGSVPVADPATYRLRVTGLVETEQHYSLTDLAALPQTDVVADFQCVTGWRVPDVPWSGVRLGTIVAAAGVKPQAKALRFVSFDGSYTESLTLDQARDPGMIVALRMLNEPVTHDHGGPVRLYAAPMYGYKSIKWLSEIQLVDRVEPGYWEGFGYAIDGWVGASNGRDDAPTT
jgi:DMSO/TMAO reductase YedYZ molybdopterin-dependent catalytic subunit